MLNMASEQRTESVMIRLRQGSPVIATGYEVNSYMSEERVPAEVLFVRARRIKVVTREIVSSLC